MTLAKIWVDVIVTYHNNEEEAHHVVAEIKERGAKAVHLALIGKDTEAWINLFAEDVVVEFPYAAALSLPEQFEGKSAISLP